MSPTDEQTLLLNMYLCARRFDALYKRALVAANVTDFAARRRDSENRALLGSPSPTT